MVEGKKEFSVYRVSSGNDARFHESHEDSLIKDFFATPHLGYGRRRSHVYGER